MPAILQHTSLLLYARTTHASQPCAIISRGLCVVSQHRTWPYACQCLHNPWRRRTRTPRAAQGKTKATHADICALSSIVSSRNCYSRSCRSYWATPMRARGESPLDSGYSCSLPPLCSCTYESLMFNDETRILRGTTLEPWTHKAMMAKHESRIQRLAHVSRARR